MRLKELGEFGLIQRIAPLFKSHLPLGVEGIGNDCAVIPFQEDVSYLVTTDLMNENVHFIKAKIDPVDLGYKSLAVNLSDIAAMGGVPQYAFLSLGLPVETSVEWMDHFFAGFRELAMQKGVFLLGGDTTRAETIVINVLVIGKVEKRHMKRRSQACVGDVICCTGYLGDSGAGLKILLEGLPQEDVNRSLIRAHVHPRVHLEEGVWLAEQAGVHAMMDMSDGLASDIQRIMEESDCGAHIAVDGLPLSSELKEVCHRWGWQAENLGLTAGEDYCLLATVDPSKFVAIQEAYVGRFQRPLFRVGTILAERVLKYSPHVEVGSGYDHFKGQKDIKDIKDIKDERPKGQRTKRH